MFKYLILLDWTMRRYAIHGLKPFGVNIKICLKMTNILELIQNALPMKTALVHQTHACLIFVSVGQGKNATADLMYVQLDIANVARTMNVHLQNIALLENA